MAENPTPAVENSTDQLAATGIDYNTPQQIWYDEPKFSELVGAMPVPAQTPLPFSVQGFVGGGFNLGTPQGQAAGLHVGISNALNYIISKSKTPITRWAATQNLMVIPRAGVQLNAYYDRKSLKFFYQNDPYTKTTVYTCDASTVYVHEAGHAVLDCLRPDFWGTASLEIQAFHESFGDCLGLLNLLTYDAVIHSALGETKGNLWQSNVVSQCAWGMGTAMFKTPRPMRDAYNHFVYADPQTLPSSGPDDKLCREPHNFSRVWTGTFYEMLLTIAGKLVDQGWDWISALKNSRDICARYLMAGIPIAPSTPKFFDAIASAILAVDSSEGSPYQAELTQVFANRNVLVQAPMGMAASEETPEDLHLTKDEIVLKAKAVLIYLLKKRLTMRLADSKITLPTDGNPLYNVEVELPADGYYRFNAAGKLVERVQPVLADILQAVLLMLQYLHTHDLVGQDRPWYVENGKLHRRYSCNEGSYVNNSMVKGAPEYGKPWKPQNNAGCCSCCKPQKHEVPPPIKLGCVVRARTAQSTQTVTGQLTRTKAC